MGDSVRRVKAYKRFLGLFGRKAIEAYNQQLSSEDFREAKPGAAREGIKKPQNVYEISGSSMRRGEKVLGVWFRTRG